MSACDRFESEGLQRFVAGEPLGGHFETCPDCRTALAGYQAVVRTLEQARHAYTPPGNWEAKVWAEVQRRKPASLRWFGWAAGALGAAAAAALAVFVLPSMGGVDSLRVTQTFERGSGPMVRGGASGQTVPPGSVMLLSARIPRSKLGDLRVYLGKDQLVFQCATQPTCIHSRDGLEARVPLERLGSYRVVAIAAEKQLPPATGNLDADYAAAIRAGEARELAPVEVL